MSSEFSFYLSYINYEKGRLSPEPWLFVSGTSEASMFFC